MNLRIIDKLINKSISLNVKYHVNLAKTCIHLISLQELQETSFFICMHVDEFNIKANMSFNHI
jgi:hypothetical protein